MQLQKYAQGIFSGFLWFSWVFAMVLYVFRINSVLKQPLKHVFSWQTIENHQWLAEHFCYS